MKVFRKKTIDLTKEDHDNIEYVGKQENTDDTNAIRIALKEYRKNREQIKQNRTIIENQQRTIALLEKVIANQEEQLYERV